MLSRAELICSAACQSVFGIALDCESSCMMGNTGAGALPGLALYHEGIFGHYLPHRLGRAARGDAGGLASA